MSSVLNGRSISVILREVEAVPRSLRQQRNKGVRDVCSPSLLTTLRRENMEKHEMPFIGICSGGILGVAYSWGVVEYADGKMSEAYRGFSLETGKELKAWCSRNPIVVLSNQEIQDLAHD